MDPANYAAHMLPKIEYTEARRSKTYSIDSNYPSNYSEFCNEFKEYVSGDCYAITVNDEILYNSYEPKSIRDSLQDDMVRQMIIDAPHNFFAKLFRKKEDARVIVYIFGQTPLFLAAYYHAEKELLTLEYYKSQKFMVTQGLNTARTPILAAESEAAAHVAEVSCSVE
jgi:hypothetical protein